MAAGAGLSESTRRWLISPQGLLAACREAVAKGDADFLDELDTSPLLSLLDDESLAAPGPVPSERARALLCAGRLALWCLEDADGARAREWLGVATRGFSGPDDTPWTAPAGECDGLEPSAADPRGRAEALVAAAYRTCAHPALLPVSDLLQDFLSGPEEPKASPGTRVPLLISRHQQGELVHFVAVRRSGPPGVGLDPLVGPFTRADAAFHDAVATAWEANRSFALGARWSVISDRTGAAVEVIGGRSVGAAAGTALRYLSNPDLAPLDPSWAITGALDATGALTSLLDEDRNLATYRTKLTAAGDRTVLVPTCDHPYITGIVEGGGLKARLRPVGSLAGITDRAQHDAAVSTGSRPSSLSPGRTALFPTILLIATLAAAAAAVVARARGMGLLAASAAGAASATIGWTLATIARRRPSPRIWTAAAVIAAIALPVGAGGLYDVRPDRPLAPQIMRTFELPIGSEPSALVADKKGNLWFTEPALGRIGRITSAGDKIEFAIPRPPGDSNASPVSPNQLATGPDGNIWFLANDIIGKVTPTGQFTIFRLQGAGTGGLVAGPDGNMWVTQKVPKIARVTPAGQITEFTLPLDKNYKDNYLAQPVIAVGRDGNLWFTEPRGRIGKITPTGDIREFNLPTADAEPGPIVAGPDGNLWFTETGVVGKIGRISLSGEITEFNLMRVSQPQNLTVGPDGAIWFTERGLAGDLNISGSGRIGRIDPKAPDEFPWYLPLPKDSDPGGLATGGDRNLWLTDRKKHQIVTLPAVGPARIRAAEPAVAQSFLAAISAFQAEFKLADDQLVAARKGSDLEPIKASYARQGDILRTFTTTFSALTFPPAFSEDVRSVNQATNDFQAVLDKGSQITNEEELRLGLNRIGLTLARVDAGDSWYVALNVLGTHLGLDRTRNGPVAAGKGSPQTSRTSPTTRPAPATIPVGQALISGEKLPPVILNRLGRSLPEQWPEPCTMLTDPEINAITPGVTVTRTGRSGPWSAGQTPKNTFCIYEVRRPSDPSPVPGQIRVSITNIATPTSDAVSFAADKATAAADARLRPEDYKDYGKTLGADDAFWRSGPGIDCTKGTYRFSVSGSSYRLGSGADTEWRDKVLTQVVATLSAKMT